MIVVTILLIFLPYQGDNGSSLSKYSFKIDKNKVKWGGRVHVFQTWKKQVSKSVKLRLIDLTKISKQNKTGHLINNNINEKSNN